MAQVEISASRVFEYNHLADAKDNFSKKEGSQFNIRPALGGTSEF
jgi:hypothetical protein